MLSELSSVTMHLIVNQEFDRKLYTEYKVHRNTATVPMSRANHSTRIPCHPIFQLRTGWEFQGMLPQSSQVACVEDAFRTLHLNAEL